MLTLLLHQLCISYVVALYLEAVDTSLEFDEVETSSVVGVRLAS